MLIPLSTSLVQVGLETCPILSQAHFQVIRFFFFDFQGPDTRTLKFSLFCRVRFRDYSSSTSSHQRTCTL